MERKLLNTIPNKIHYGSRTGLNVKEGKNIRVDEDGFENFSDYFTSPETSGLTLRSNRSTRKSLGPNSAKSSQSDVTIASMSSFTPSTAADFDFDSEGRKSADSAGSNRSSVNRIACPPPDVVTEGMLIGRTGTASSPIEPRSQSVESSPPDRRLRSGLQATRRKSAAAASLIHSASDNALTTTKSVENDGSLMRGSDAPLSSENLTSAARKSGRSSGMQSTSVWDTSSDVVVAGSVSIVPPVRVKCSVAATVVTLKETPSAAEAAEPVGFDSRKSATVVMSSVLGTNFSLTNQNTALEAVSAYSTAGQHSGPMEANSASCRNPSFSMVSSAFSEQPESSHNSLSLTSVTPLSATVTGSIMRSSARLAVSKSGVTSAARSENGGRERTDLVDVLDEEMPQGAERLPKASVKPVGVFKQAKSANRMSGIPIPIRVGSSRSISESAASIQGQVLGQNQSKVSRGDLHHEPGQVSSPIQSQASDKGLRNDPGQVLGQILPDQAPIEDLRPDPGRVPVRGHTPLLASQPVDQPRLNLNGDGMGTISGLEAMGRGVAGRTSSPGTGGTRKRLTFSSTGVAPVVASNPDLTDDEAGAQRQTSLRQSTAALTSSDRHTSHPIPQAEPVSDKTCDVFAEAGSLLGKSGLGKSGGMQPVLSSIDRFEEIVQRMDPVIRRAKASQGHSRVERSRESVIGIASASSNNLHVSRVTDTINDAEGGNDNAAEVDATEDGDSAKEDDRTRFEAVESDRQVIKCLTKMTAAACPDIVKMSIEVSEVRRQTRSAGKGALEGDHCEEASTNEGTADKQRDKQGDKKKDKQGDIQKDKQGDKQGDKQREKQTDNQTDDKRRNISNNQKDGRDDDQTDIEGENEGDNGVEIEDSALHGASVQVSLRSSDKSGSAATNTGQRSRVKQVSINVSSAAAVKPHAATSKSGKFTSKTHGSSGESSMSDQSNRRASPVNDQSGKSGASDTALISRGQMALDDARRMSEANAGKNYGGKETNASLKSTRHVSDAKSSQGVIDSDQHSTDDEVNEVEPLLTSGLSFNQPNDVENAGVENALPNSLLSKVVNAGKKANLVAGSVEAATEASDSDDVTASSIKRHSNVSAGRISGGTDGIQSQRSTASKIGSGVGEERSSKKNAGNVDYSVNLQASTTRTSSVSNRSHVPPNVNQRSSTASSQRVNMEAVVDQPFLDESVPGNATSRTNYAKQGKSSASNDSVVPSQTTSGLVKSNAQKFGTAVVDKSVRNGSSRTLVEQSFHSSKDITSAMENSIFQRNVAAALDIQAEKSMRSSNIAKATEEVNTFVTTGRNAAKTSSNFVPLDDTPRQVPESTRGRDLFGKSAPGKQIQENKGNSDDEPFFNRSRQQLSAREECETFEEDDFELISPKKSKRVVAVGRGIGKKKSTVGSKQQEGNLQGSKRNKGGNDKEKSLKKSDEGDTVAYDLSEADSDSSVEQEKFVLLGKLQKKISGQKNAHGDSLQTEGGCCVEVSSRGETQTTKASTKSGGKLQVNSANDGQITTVDSHAECQPTVKKRKGEATAVLKGKNGKLQPAFDNDDDVEPDSDDEVILESASKEISKLRSNPATNLLTAAEEMTKALKAEKAASLKSTQKLGLRNPSSEEKSTNVLKRNNDDVTGGRNATVAARGGISERENDEPSDGDRTLVEESSASEIKGKKSAANTLKGRNAGKNTSARGLRGVDKNPDQNAALNVTQNAVQASDSDDGKRRPATSMRRRVSSVPQGSVIQEEADDESPAAALNLSGVGLLDSSRISINSSTKRKQYKSDGNAQDKSKGAKKKAVKTVRKTSQKVAVNGSREMDVDFLVDSNQSGGGDVDEGEGLDCEVVLPRLKLSEFGVLAKHLRADDMNMQQGNNSDKEAEEEEVDALPQKKNKLSGASKTRSKRYNTDAQSNQVVERPMVNHSTPIVHGSKDSGPANRCLAERLPVANEAVDDVSAILSNSAGRLATLCRPRKSVSFHKKATGGRKRGMAGRRNEGTLDGDDGVLVTQAQPADSDAEEADYSADEQSTTPVSSLPHCSTASPLRYFEVDYASAERIDRAMKRGSATAKIFRPEEGSEGCRRSKRTRVAPLDWFRGERINYNRRKSGWSIAGILSPQPATSKTNKVQKLVKAIAREENKKKNEKEKPRRVSADLRNLSVHASVQLSADQPAGSEQEESGAPANPPGLLIIDPVTRQEVFVECVKTKDQHHMVGATNQAPTVEDSILLCKPIRQKSFASGTVIIRGLKTKSLQTPHDTLMFTVIYGKVQVTIHRTTVVLESGDKFFVPAGNAYGIRNLRRDDASLDFVQIKQPTQLINN